MNTTTEIFPARVSAVGLLLLALLCSVRLNGIESSRTEGLPTRDVLPVYEPGDPGEKVACWPPPEDSTNLNKRQLGDLKLTEEEENDIVAFLRTLTDGYDNDKSNRSHAKQLTSLRQGNPEP